MARENRVTRGHSDSTSIASFLLERVCSVASGPRGWVYRENDQSHLSVLNCQRHLRCFCETPSQLQAAPSTFLSSLTLLFLRKVPHQASGSSAVRKVPPRFSNCGTLITNDASAQSNVLFNVRLSLVAFLAHASKSDVSRASTTSTKNYLVQA